MIVIESKRRKRENIEAKYPGCAILDVTSSSPQPFGQQFSPFYPHGGIPVPNSPGVTSACVEAVWQGLKVFEHCGIDTSLFANTTMKGLKRTVRRYGKPLGHQYGVSSTQLLDYLTARRLIYLPTYRWVLEHCLSDKVEQLREVAARRTLVLLDYDTNGDICNPRKPLSHASLIKAYLEGTYPDKETPANIQLNLF